MEGLTTDYLDNALRERIGATHVDITDVSGKQDHIGVQT